MWPDLAFPEALASGSPFCVPFWNNNTFVLLHDLDRLLVARYSEYMKTRSIIGLVMILAVLAWDVDAMRPHVAAHSWLTLAYVSIFFLGHLVDYLTIGRIVNRMQEIA